MKHPNLILITVIACLMSGCCGEGVDFILCLIHTPIKQQTNDNRKHEQTKP